MVRGEGFDGKDFRFNDIELVTDKREYEPGDKVKLLHQHQPQATAPCCCSSGRPTASICRRRCCACKGKSIEEEIAVVQKDMPNFFIEAVTIANGRRSYRGARSRSCRRKSGVLNVEVLPSQQEYKPGQKATVKVKLTDFFGKPFVGSTVLTHLRQERRVHLRRLATCRRSRSSSGNGGGITIRSTESSLDHDFGNLLRHGRDRHGQPRRLRRDGGRGVGRQQRGQGANARRDCRP